MSGLSYRESGVDVGAAERFIAAIAPLVAATQGPTVVEHRSRFAGLIAPDLSGIAEPVLAATCDGVGTKVLLARGPEDFEGLGVDLVAMSVNDLLPLRAKPLLFLDYLGTGRLDPPRLEAAVRGIAGACREAHCALLGGETAELPGMYGGGEVEMVGFAVGLVDRGSLPDPDSIRPGDQVVALPSTGLHANGFSLARTALFERGGIATDAVLPTLGRPLIEVLLTPTAIYVDRALSLMDAVPVKAAAHVTGGGLTGRTRALVNGDVDIRLGGAIAAPPIFDVIREAGDVSTEEMESTFNMGIGFLAVVAAADVTEAEAMGWVHVGEITAGSGEVLRG